MTKPTAILPSAVILSAVILLFPPVVTLSEQVEQDTTREEQDTWDIEQSLGPTVPLSFETDEGTWMNVDLDPAGATVVFDLLGDLYTMPIAGGTATRISSGQSFDMQPRFSPDGSAITFISDRSGAFNIWLMDPDGSNLRQVSEESNREVNSPSWSPDGQYIFVRKHFVDERSLGAGEVLSLIHI